MTKAAGQLSCLYLLVICLPTIASAAIFDVKKFGATGHKNDDAQPAIQKALDACAAAGGGTVSLPRGEYSSGTLRLRSHVHFRVESGAILYAITNENAFPYGEVTSKAALLAGENLEDLRIEGAGIIDGQAEYDWRLDDFEKGFEHKTIMEKLGKPVLRSVPKGYPSRQSWPHLLWLANCKDIEVTGIHFLHSPSWSIALYACERAKFENLYIYTSLKEAVWADGIDLDGCKGVLVNNCTIETGDDCVAFVSQDSWGPAKICEQVVVTNCRLSSASAAIKFSEGNRVAIRDIRVVDSLFNNVNRGLALNNTLGGAISNIVFSNLVINCSRGDWFWAGDGQPFRLRITRLSEFSADKPAASEPAPGTIKNITIQNVIAHAKGSSLFHGHAESWLDGIRLENIKLYVSTDPTAPFDIAENALDFRHAKNVQVKNVEVRWEQPALKAWKSAVSVDDASEVEISGLVARGAWPEERAPAVLLKQVNGATLRDCRAAEGTQTFLEVKGAKSQDIMLETNELSRAATPYHLGDEVAPNAVKILRHPALQ